MWLMDINGTNGRQIWTQPAKRVSRYSYIVGLRFPQELETPSIPQTPKNEGGPVGPKKYQ